VGGGQLQQGAGATPRGAAVEGGWGGAGELVSRGLPIIEKDSQPGTEKTALNMRGKKVASVSVRTGSYLGVTE